MPYYWIRILLNISETEALACDIQLASHPYIKEHHCTSYDTGTNNQELNFLNNYTSSVEVIKMLKKAVGVVVLGTTSTLEENRHNKTSKLIVVISKDF